MVFSCLSSAETCFLYPAYRATLLYIYLVTHTVVREMRKNLVEVFARVRVNLRILKGKTAGKRACWRTKRGMQWSYSLSVHMRKVSP